LSVGRFKDSGVRLKLESEPHATFGYWGQTDEKGNLQAGENVYFLARSGEYHKTISVTTDQQLMIIFHSRGGMGIEDIFLRESNNSGGEKAVAIESSGSLRIARLDLSSGKSYDIRFSIPDEGGLVSITTDKQVLVYDGFKLGDRVILGSHQLIMGRRNWAPAMDKYVGCIATISKLTGVERDQEEV